MMVSLSLSPSAILFFCCYGFNGFVAAPLPLSLAGLVTSMANFPPTLPSPSFHPIFPWTSSDREKREERKNNFDQIVHHYHHCTARVQTDPQVLMRKTCSVAVSHICCSIKIECTSASTLDFYNRFGHFGGRLESSEWMWIACGWLWEFGCALSGKQRMGGRMDGSRQSEQRSGDWRERKFPINR